MAALPYIELISGFTAAWHGAAKSDLLLLLSKSSNEKSLLIPQVLLPSYYILFTRNLLHSFTGWSARKHRTENALDDENIFRHCSIQPHSGGARSTPAGIPAYYDTGFSKTPE